jgi:predicted RNA-binding protein (virulence factor B family)
VLYGLGYGKDILVPFKKQTNGKGKRYLVYLYMDEKKNRLVASSKTNQFFKRKMVKKGEEVDLIVSHITELGINVIINSITKACCIRMKYMMMLFVLVIVCEDILKRSSIIKLMFRCK